jgi:ubiquinone/menaquinone biosynthesis C-methylase UbiE
MRLQGPEANPTTDALPGGSAILSPAMTDAPLHELDPTGRFGTRAADYARFRPDYPRACIEAVLQGLTGPRVADVGAGTGISSRMLAAAGARVWAIEPNRDMRENAEHHPQILWVDGSAESTTLPDCSIDVAACFQAFHWFDASRALPELHRILVPGGRIALVWNERDRSDELTAAYSEIVARFAVIPPAEERKGVADPLQASALFSGQEMLTFSHHQELTAEDLVGRARSTSYLPSEGAAAEELWETLRRLHSEHAAGSGPVRLRYVTKLHRAHRT